MKVWCIKEWKLIPLMCAFTSNNLQTFLHTYICLAVIIYIFAANKRFHTVNMKVNSYLLYITITIRSPQWLISCVIVLYYLKWWSRPLQKLDFLPISSSSLLKGAPAFDAITKSHPRVVHRKICFELSASVFKTRLCRQPFSCWNYFFVFLLRFQ